MAQWPRPADDRCPSREDLLLASEGELSSWRTRQIMAHADRCANCHDYLASMSLQVRELDALAMEVPSLEPLERPAGHRETFEQRLMQEVQRDDSDKRAGTARQGLPVRRWLPYAAMVPILATSFLFSNRYTETLRADELLKGAAQEQRAKAPTFMQRVQIRMKKSAAGVDQTSGATTLTRELGASASPRTATSVQRLDEEMQMAARMAALQFDLNDPLSAVRFESWRATRRSKRDLITESDDRRLRALTTTTNDGGIWKAIFVVRLTDLHPVRQTLSFVDGYELVSEEVEAWKVETPPLTPVLAPPASKASAASSATTGRDDAKSTMTADVARVRAAKTAAEALPAFRLEAWRQRTFNGSPASDSFLPDLVRSVDRLSMTARALAASSRSPAGSGARVAQDYRAFRNQLEIVEGQLNQFLGSSTYQSVKRVPADIDERAPVIAARADALRSAVRTLVAQPDVPIRSDIEAGTAEPEALVDVRRALDALWSSVTPGS